MAQVLVAARAIDVDQQRYRCGAFQVEITDLMNEKQANVFPLHLAPIDRFFLVDENSAYPMTYVIQIECQGVLDREAFEAALRQAMDRHILLKAVIRPAKRGMLCWVSSDGMFPPIDWNTDDVPVQCDGGEGFDMSRELGLRIWVRCDDSTTRIVLQFHHAVTDGTGAFRFIGDLLVFYDRYFGNEKNELLPLDARLLRNRRRRMIDAYAQENQWTLWKAIFRELRTVFGRRVLPVSLPRTVRVDRPSFPGIEVQTISEAEHAALRDASLRDGVMMNDVMLFLLFQTVRSWNERHDKRSRRQPIRLLMPTDMRDKEEYGMPAANMTSYTFLTREQRECDRPTQLLQSIREETAKIKHHRVGVNFIDTISAAENSPRIMRWLLGRRRCLSSAVLTNNGDPSRRFTAKLRRKEGLVQSGNIIIERFSGVPPLRDLTRTSLAIMTYAKQLTISVRCDPYYFEPSDARQFLELYLHHLRQYANCAAEPVGAAT
ncbi:MAG: hypothetical protein R3E01_01540 [Pirellulaceae bacterium]|nr:hypothetical protein [Planctomycetales bacterium]